MRKWPILRLSTSQNFRRKRLFKYHSKIKFSIIVAWSEDLDIKTSQKIDIITKFSRHEFAKLLYFLFYIQDNFLESSIVKTNFRSDITQFSKIFFCFKNVILRYFLIYNYSYRGFFFTKILFL